MEHQIICQVVLWLTNEGRFLKQRKKCFLPLTICGKKNYHVLPSSHDLDSGHDTDRGDDAGPGHRGGDVQGGAETVTRGFNLLFEDDGLFVCFSTLRLFVNYLFVSCLFCLPTQYPQEPNSSLRSKVQGLR